MTLVSWPRNSVRPYESLWSLSHRFLWLNLPKRSHLAVDIEVSEFSYYCLDLIFGIAPERRLAIERFRHLLKLTPTQWRRSTLDAETVGGIAQAGLRYCPSCIQMAYHSAVFQLRSLSICPIHFCQLIDCCPFCGQLIPTTLDPRVLKAPFACTQCKKMLTNCKILVDPPTVEGANRIGRVYSWFTSISNLPRFEARSLSSNRERDLGLLSPMYPLLGRVVGRRPPMIVSRKWIEPQEGQIWHTTKGESSAQTERNRKETQEDELAGEPLVLYKAMLRYIRKGPGKVHTQLLAFHQRSDSVFSTTDDPAGRSTKVRALAVLLFRFSMEGWHDLPRSPKIRIHPDQIVATLERISPWSLTPHVVGDFKSSPNEWRWIRSHFIMATFINIFRRAEAMAETMVDSVTYAMRDVSRTLVSQDPYSLAARNRNGSIEFWSLSVPLGDERPLEQGTSLMRRG